MKGDAFTADKFRWLDQVVADAALPTGAFRLAYVISTYVNRERGYAWPDQPVLAATLRMDERTVRRLASRLVSHGHLDIAVSHVRGVANQYRLINKGTEPSGLKGTKRPGKKPDSAARLGDVHTGQSVQIGRTILSENTGQKCPVTPLSQTIEETIDGYMGERPTDFFDVFWKAYPRKVDKQAARKAFEKIVTKKVATPEAVIAGAERYASERQGQPSKYTKGPERWLNAHCWLDEATPKQQPIIDRPRTGAASAAFGIDAELGTLDS